MANYQHTNSKDRLYHLNSEPTTNGKAKLYFFSKDARDTACELPEGYVVIENERTGLPVLKKQV